MSFILDALKKSENERARQNGPALLQARVVPRRRGVPAWALIVGLVLLANIVLLVIVLRRTSAPVAEPAVAAAPVTPPATAAPAPAPAPAPAVIAPPTRTLPPLPTPAAERPIESAPPPASVVNPADYRPALPPAEVSRGADMNLPTAADLAATGLPPLRLALHAYDDVPRNRYVLINSQRLVEGDTTAEGVRVERITLDGVVMSWRGQQFRLQPGE